MLIYLLYNNVNGKCYIGQTIHTLQSRWNQHQRAAESGRTSLIARAIRKHGSQSFHAHALISGLTCKDDLNKFEKFLISLFESTNPNLGYNVSEGGHGGMHHEDHKQKCIAANKRRAGGHLSDEHKEKLRVALTCNKNNTGKVQRKARSASCGQKCSALAKEKWQNGTLKGFPKSPEVRKKISDARKNYWFLKTVAWG